MRFFSNKGIALIMVISCIAMLSIMMVEFTFNSRLNLQVSNTFKNASKARDLARSGIHFASMELLVYKKIREHPMVKQIPGFNEGMLDMIWKFGFIYPPLPSKRATFGTHRAAEELIEKSKIDGKIHVEIFDESTKININLLGQQKYRAGIKYQLDALFEQRKVDDEDFYDKYRDLQFEDLINNIIDWIDSNNEKIVGGDEESYYSRLSRNYKPKNAPLATVSELALVEGFDNDEIFDLLRPYITVYSTGGINVNSADEKMLLTISPELSPEDVKSIIEHRETKGFFKDVKAFEAFCKKTLLKSPNFNKNPQVPLSVRSNMFSLTSTAEVKRAVQTVRAVMDLSRVLPSGAPEIVYWNLN